MGSFMYLQVLGAGEHFSTSREGAREGFLSCMNSYVVHQLVLGLERPSVAHTALPKTTVVSLLGPSYVLHSNVSDYLVHGVENLVAGLPRFW